MTSRLRSAGKSNVRAHTYALIASCHAFAGCTYLELESEAVAAHHCERSEAIQSLSAVGFWIASLRSQ
ncbi:hypothetical protein EOW77_0027120 [Bradyrhizobium yuanmingense]|nr:hypothetical protein EOW77_0027120 [Bradyrhizobium yuanmingense]